MTDKQRCPDCGETDIDLYGLCNACWTFALSDSEYMERYGVCRDLACGVCYVQFDREEDDCG